MHVSSFFQFEFICIYRKETKNTFTNTYCSMYFPILYAEQQVITVDYRDVSNSLHDKITENYIFFILRFQGLHVIELLNYYAHVVFYKDIFAKY